MKKWVLFATLSLILTGCLNETHTEIDWVDFVRFNDTTYYGSYSKEITSETDLGEVASIVEFKVAENVTNSSYKIKNGDAAFHEKGTKIYEVKGTEGIFAVKSDHKINGYQIYSEKERNRFDEMDQTTVIKIELYQQLDDGMLLHMNTIDNKETIQTLLSILNAGQEDREFEPNWTEHNLDYYHLLFYHGGPIVDSYSLHYDGETYYWYPFEATILDEKISEFIITP
ncbi:MAG: hypothetical protein ABS944_13900 [Solibacillus sp.]|uniref:hypothetical protein n=1 Tax=unclassified Solibacillus TaxID=2637870 RepID=UPI0030FA17EE